MDAHHHDDSSADEEEYFATPCMPFIPLLGIAVNWALIAQLEVLGLILLGLYVGLTVFSYALWGPVEDELEYHAVEVAMTAVSTADHSHSSDDDSHRIT